MQSSNVDTIAWSKKRKAPPACITPVSSFKPPLLVHDMHHCHAAVLPHATRYKEYTCKCCKICFVWRSQTLCQPCLHSSHSRLCHHAVPKPDLSQDAHHQCTPCPGIILMQVRYCYRFDTLPVDQTRYRYTTAQYKANKMLVNRTRKHLHSRGCWVTMVSTVSQTLHIFHHATEMASH